MNQREKRVLTRLYGNQVVTKHNGEWRIKKQDGTCIFQAPNGLCKIHTQKPNNCDMFPFYVFREPRHHLRGNKAEYWVDNTCFYIYINDFCKGLGKGSQIRDRLPKVIRLWAQKSDPRYMTAEDTATSE